MGEMVIFAVTILLVVPMLHFFDRSISGISLPEQFTFPFHYTPHPLCKMAAEQVQAYVATRTEWTSELAGGKMFGVLLVQTTDGAVGFLAAFSGNLAGKNRHSFFVPPVYDLLQPDGFFRLEEERISAINRRIAALEQDERFLALHATLKKEKEAADAALGQAKTQLKAAKKERDVRRRSLVALSEEEQARLIKESQHQKAAFKRLERTLDERVAQCAGALACFEAALEALRLERKERSAALQQKMFAQFRLLNGNGEPKDLCAIFEQTVQKTPPAGAGECALPKLLQYAYQNHLKPLAMAEFWWGASPKTEIRRHGQYYPACKGKCEPILTHMLQGLRVETDPLSAMPQTAAPIEVLYDDAWLAVVAKPAGMLSVPGKANAGDSFYDHLRRLFPGAAGPMMVHRLDMATSGVLLFAKTKEVHQALQAQFERRTVKKEYIALLEGVFEKVGATGTVDLPLCLNPLDRPRQMVDRVVGKKSLTGYRVLDVSGGRTRIAFFPFTGRTHQLRVHAAHPEGLNCPIVGDELYGVASDRLYLHAEAIEFRHPVSGETICVQRKADF